MARNHDDEAFAAARRSRIEAKKREHGKEKAPDGGNGGDAGKKPLFAGLWDAMNPKRADSYTFEQDMRHSTIMFVLILTIAVTAGWSAFTLWSHYRTMTSATLLVPAAAFTSSQADTVVSELEGQGFIDVSYVEGTGVYAHGSEDMVEQYKSDFKAKVLQDDLDNVGNSYLTYGIVSMELLDDDTSIKLTTLTDTSDSSVIGYMVTNNDVQGVIDAAAQWCAMNGDGRLLHVSFVTVDDDGNETEYLSDDVDMAARIVSNLESAESEASDAESADESEASDGTGTDGDAGADESENSNTDASAN